MSEEVFSRWQDPTIERLQQENQRLKETIKRCYTPEEIDFEIMPVKAELEAEKDINNNLHKTIDKLRVNLYETQQERDLYKEVIEEVREEVCEYKKIMEDGIKQGAYYSYLGSLQQRLEKLLQILDKAKGEENE